jgi:hypothetical protein
VGKTDNSHLPGSSIGGGAVFALISEGMNRRAINYLGATNRSAWCSALNAAKSRSKRIRLSSAALGTTW